MAAVHGPLEEEAEVKAVACSMVGDGAVVCSGAGAEAAACSWAGIEGGRWRWQHDGF
jgi:hypothetical protein